MCELRAIDSFSKDNAAYNWISSQVIDEKTLMHKYWTYRLYWLCELRAIHSFGKENAAHNWIS